MKRRKEKTLMDKAKLVLEVIQKLLKVAEDLKILSESIQALCTVVSEGLSEPEEPKQIEAPKVSLEQVRGILAEKSKAGHAEEVRAIIRKYGADKLSAVDPVNFPAIMKEAEGLTDE